MNKIIDSLVEERSDRRLALLVNRAIEFLAPYFGLSGDKLWHYIPPIHTVFSGEASFAGGTIFLPRNTTERRNSEMIRHEVGHWFHDTLNPEYTILKDTELENELIETVASYSGLIYLVKKNPIINPKFTLPRLVRMDVIIAEKIKEDLKRFYDEIWIKIMGYRKWDF